MRDNLVNVTANIIIRLAPSMLAGSLCHSWLVGVFVYTFIAAINIK